MNSNAFSYILNSPNALENMSIYIYIYMCVCVCVCVHTNMSTHTYIEGQVKTEITKICLIALKICVYKCMNTWVYINVYAHKYPKNKYFIYIYIYIYIHTHRKNIYRDLRLCPMGHSQTQKIGIKNQNHPSKQSLPYKEQQNLTFSFKSAGKNIEVQNMCRAQVYGMIKT